MKPTTLAPELLELAYQDKAADSLSDGFILKGLAAQLLQANTGYGKTFIIAKAIKKLRDHTTFFTDHVSPYHVIWLTKATIVEKTKRDIKNYGLEKFILVVNYDQMRSKFGEMFLTEKTRIVHGEPVIDFIWDKFMTAKLFIFDECHTLKNEGAIITKIVQDLIDQIAKGDHFPSEPKLLYTSATFAARVSEAKSFATATQVPFTFGWDTRARLTTVKWPSFAKSICGGSDPIEFSPSSCKALREYLEKYIIKVAYNDVQSSFAAIGRKLYHAKNSCDIVDFDTYEDRVVYNLAWERYLEELAKIDREAPGGMAAIWGATLKFRQAAGILKAPILARRMYENDKLGFSPVASVNFKATLAKIVETLVNKYYIPREQISTIWGGISKVKDLKEEYQDLDLGTQSLKERQINIDRFQSGEARFGIFTFKSGGYGLSLHHENFFGRARTIDTEATYSAMELVQALGRTHRVTSLSNTNQKLVFFKDTVEEAVAAKVGIKLKSLTEMVGSRESWADILTADESTIKRVIEKARTGIALDEKRDFGRVLSPRDTKVIYEDFKIDTEGDDESLAGIYIGEDETTGVHW